MVHGQKASCDFQGCRTLTLFAIYRDIPDLWKTLPVRTHYAGGFLEGEEGRARAKRSGARRDEGEVAWVKTGFRLPEDHPAFERGFKPIPVEKIGLRRNEFRRGLPERKPAR